MPASKSQRAPCFSGQDDEILSEFLREYEDLANGNGLTEKQKVETILRYVPRSLSNLWSTLPGYQTATWSSFRAELEELYPDIDARTRCTRQGLTEFVELSAEYRIRNERDILKYYRNFLTIALPLVKEGKLTHDDFHAEFFKGFHTDDQNVLAVQVRFTNPHHPTNEPFNIQDVLSAARQYFASDQFHKPPQRHAHTDLRGCSKTRRNDPERLIQQLFGDKCSRKPARDDDSDSDQEDSDAECPEYKTCSVCFKEPSLARTQPNDDDDAATLITKLRNLSVCEPSYFVLYSQCQERFPSIAQLLPKPDLFAAQMPPASATVAYQSPPTPA